MPRFITSNLPVFHNAPLKRSILEDIFMLETTASTPKSLEVKCSSTCIILTTENACLMHPKQLFFSLSHMRCSEIPQQIVFFHFLCILAPFSYLSQEGFSVASASLNVNLKDSPPILLYTASRTSYVD